jgi:hypothetical protein
MNIAERICPILIFSAWVKIEWDVEFGILHKLEFSTTVLTWNSVLFTDECASKPILTSSNVKSHCTSCCWKWGNSLLF